MTEKESGKTEEEVIAVTDEELRAREAEGLEASPESEGEEEDERLSKDEEEHEEDKDRRKDREKRSRRNQRRKEARERLERENRFYDIRNIQLEKKVAELERRLTGTQEFSLDNRISQFEAAIKKAESVHAEAVSSGKGDEASEALRLRDQFRENLSKLREAKDRAGAEDGSDQESPSPPDPRVLSRAREWTSRNSWYDPGRRDYKSRLAGAIDDSLVAEGYDPTTEEYWEELDDRIREVFPDIRASEEATPPKKPNGKAAGAGGGPKFRSGGQHRSLKKGEYYLSPERVEAMKEAGIWDDPAARAKMIKRYQTFDREQGEG